MRDQPLNAKAFRKNRVLLVSHIYPEYLATKILDQPLIPIQTQRFGIALLDALRRGFDNSIEVLSVAPLLDFPHSRLLIAPSAKWKINHKINATMVPFLNLIILKHLTRFVATLAFVFQWTLRNRKYERIIILHGVQSCQIWGILLGQVLAPCKTVSFLTDDVGIPLKWENALLRKLRLVDVHLIKFGLQKLSGIIAMTPRLAEKLGPGLPVLIIPTIQNLASKVDSNKNRNPNDRSFTIVYTGRLSQIYGIDLLIDTFKQANRPNWRLLITGWGEMENAVRDLAFQNPQVEFLGFLDSAGIAELYRQADVFVNPKLTSTAIANLAFPSKIVEYLSTGIPVVSTDLPIFNDDFRQYLIIARSDTPEELIQRLDEVFSWSIQQRESWGARAIDFVQNELSPNVQGARIRSFVESLSNSVIC